MSDRGTQTETRIEQVRELMFGPQLRECYSRIEQLESLVAHMREDTQKGFDEVRDLLSYELNAAVAVSDKKLRALDLKAGESVRNCVLASSRSKRSLTPGSRR